MKKIMSVEELFIKAFDDESLQSIFFYELLQHDVYVLGTAQDFDGVLEDGSELNIVSLRSEEGTFIPVFLSKESMEFFLDESREEYLRAKGVDILETLKHNHIVINPGQAETMVLYDHEVQAMLAQGKN